MEYTYRTRPHENLVQVEINPYQLIIREKGKDRSIPYPNITDVRLERKGNFYCTHIHSLDFGSLRITNRLYTESNQFQDQSRQYFTFVRVLHYHLSTKCSAEFYSGWKPQQVLLKFILLFTVSAILYSVEDYFDVLAIGPLVTPSLLLGLGALLLITPYLGNWPKAYHPSDIPLNMLPPAS